MYRCICRFLKECVVLIRVALPAEALGADGLLSDWDRRLASDLNAYNSRFVQPVPWKMRLGMIVEMQIKILNGGEILVNCKTKITIWICTGRYRGIQIQSKSQFELYREIPMNLNFSISTNWLKSPHHSGFRLAFRRSLRVLSSTERAVPGLGQITLWIVLTKKWGLKKIARKSRNSCRLNGRGYECIGTVDSGPKWAQSWNQIQTLTECLGCHIYCAQLEPPWVTIVGASRAVPNRESRYPPHEGTERDGTPYLRLHKKL